MARVEKKLTRQVVRAVRKASSALSKEQRKLQLEQKRREVEVGEEFEAKSVELHETHEDKVAELLAPFGLDPEHLPSLAVDLKAGIAVWDDGKDEVAKDAAKPRQKG